MPAPALFLLALTYLGFISLGLPDAVTGVVWPSVYKHFGLPPAYLGAVLTASAVGCLASSVSAGRLIQRLGVGGLLSASCALVVVSLAGFALAPVFGWFVASAVVAGLGAGAIDSGLNAYAARHFSARQMNWLHACWGVGATLGASTAAAVLARGMAWQSTYSFLGAAMVVLTLTFFINRRTWQGAPAIAPDTPTPEPLTPPGVGEALRHPVVWAQVLVFFVYCGVEMTAGNWAFTLLTQYREVSAGVAGTAVTLYWGSLTAGRFLLGAIADHVGVHRLLPLSVTSALVGALTFVLAPWPWVGIAGLALLGFSLAPIYPGMMTQTPTRLGRLSEHAVGFQVAAAMLGAVAVPSLGGYLMQTFGHAWLNGMLGVLAVMLWLAIAALFWGARLERRASAP